jgi:UDP:flavonoid glycosyltransferase YjiC (YdhE family)
MAGTTATEPSRRQRVLFFAEAVTLAHVARPLVLAAGLPPQEHECVVACHSRYERFVHSERWTHTHLDSIPGEQFVRALAQGSPVYDTPTLRRYVQEDLALIERHRPDVVVGDFRLSLSVSARLAGVPYATVTNAYWSPHYARPGFPLPVLPMTRFMPIMLARQLFRLAQPVAFAMHCRPVNQLRREHGLPSLGHDLRRVYTDADLTLYADDEALFPTRGRPATHHYLGPLLWSPPVPLPAWWNTLPADHPVVYVTLGSSGDPALAARVVDALAALDVTVIVAMAGAAARPAPAPNVFVADYLPGLEAARRACLVVCNGGSMTTQQALAAGVPVLGIASNMDQFLNMGALEAAGLGVCLRADRCGARAVAETAGRLIAKGRARVGATGSATGWPGGRPPGWPAPPPSAAG